MRPVIGLKYGFAISIISWIMIFISILLYGIYWVVDSDFAKDILKTIAEALVGAGIVSFVFGWLNQRDLVIRIEEIFKENISTLFHPIEKMITNGSWDDYRWECLLEKVSDPNDINQDWCVQTLSISHTTVIIDRFVYLIAAASETPRALQEYTTKKDYIFRWRMTCGADKMDITSESNFRVIDVKLDGNSLQCERQGVIDVLGGKAIIVKCHVPSGRRDRKSYLEMTVQVRKYIPLSGSVDVFSEMRNTASNAEFRLNIDGSIRARKVHCESSGVRPVNPSDVNPLTTHASPTANGVISSKILARYPVQAGSSFKFNVSI